VEEAEEERREVTIKEDLDKVSKVDIKEVEAEVMEEEKINGRGIDKEEG